VSDSGLDPLHERILAAERRYGLLGGARRVLVGVSGGQDSVALVHSLVALDEVRAEVAAIHVHHGLRGAEADADEACMRGLCEGLGVECFVAHRSVAEESARSGLNLELAGRAARYEEYERIAREHGFDRVATGHTGTDRAETLLLNLFRGAGLRGIASIPPRRGGIVRPLIGATRAETGDYCRRHALPIRTDRSNLDPDYARRNAVRLRIMPLVEEHFPGAERALMRACEAAEEELAWTEPILAGWLDEATIEDDAGRLELNAERLGGLHPGALHRLLLTALEQARGDLSELGREHIERVAELLGDGRTGATVELPGRVRVRREYGRLLFEPEALEEELPSEQVELPVPGVATLPARGVTVCADAEMAPSGLDEHAPLMAWIDADAARGGLVLRNARPGDRFVPLGMTGSKKLQDFFVDEKVPRRLRDHAAVVTDGDDRIVWVVGHRIADPARAQCHARAVRLMVLRSAGDSGGAEEDVPCDATQS